MAIKRENQENRFQHILKDISQSLIRLQRPARLLKLVTSRIDREFQLSHTSILILDRRREHFIFEDSRGPGKFPVKLLKFEKNHPLLKWFSRSDRVYDEILNREAIQKWQKSHPLPSGYRLADSVFKTLEDFRVELVLPVFDQKTLVALLLLGARKNGDSFTPDEILFFQNLASICAMAIRDAQHREALIHKNLELQRQLKEIQNFRGKEKDTYRQILRSLAQQVLEKDPYTHGHVNQVERLGMMTARELELDLSEERRDILSAALILHDVGKIGIPDAILNKPAKLDPEEWAIMQSHVVKGVRILEHLDLFREVAEIIHCHHERFDGSGYPRGLKGDQIPIESKIISVVDAFHAIISRRVYDAERPVEEAFAELEKSAGSQFDPVVVEAFIRAQKREMAARQARRRSVALSEPVPQS